VKKTESFKSAEKVTVHQDRSTRDVMLVSVTSKYYGNITYANPDWVEISPAEKGLIKGISVDNELIKVRIGEKQGFVQSYTLKKKGLTVINHTKVGNVDS